MIARRDVVKCFSCDIAIYDWKRSVNVMYGTYNGVYCMAVLTSYKSQNASKDTINNDKERIQRIQYSPNWWSDGYVMRFHAEKSQNGTLTI